MYNIKNTVNYRFGIFMEILNPLTVKQKKVFDFIKSYFNINMYFPTYIEIQTYMDYKSPHAVTTILSALIKKGYVYIDKNQSMRKIRLTEMAKKLETEYNLKQINIKFCSNTKEERRKKE